MTEQPLSPSRVRVVRGIRLRLSLRFSFSVPVRVIVMRVMRVTVLIPVASLLVGLPSVGLAQSGRSAMTSDRPGLSALLPAQSFSVTGYATDPLPVELVLEPLDEDPLSGLVPEHIPDEQLKWQAKADGLPTDLRGIQTVGIVRHSGPRMGYKSSAQGWVDDVGRLTYQQENGATLSMGQVQNTSTLWGTSARLGGVQLTRLPSETSRGLLMPGAFGVSAAVGRVSNEDLGTTGTGGLTVGGPMASSTIRMGVTPDFTLESHLESGAASSAYGMGGSMAMGDWGALQLGTTQSQDTVMPTQRSGVGIQFKFDGQQFESSFESLRSGPQVSEQYLGFKHSWLLSQQTKIQVGGARELMSGTYSMNMELSIPFETLVSQWWRF